MTTTNLPREQSKMLEKLGKQWDKPTTEYLLDRLTLPELRLLLEHFQPLRDLIRSIADPQVASEQHAISTLRSELSQLEAQLQQLHASKQALEQQLHSTQTQLREAQQAEQRASQQLSQTQQQLQQAQTASHALQQQLERSTQERNALQQQVASLQARLQQHAAFGAASAVLQTLRQDNALATRLGLANLGTDSDSALRVVAVCAQRDTLERLFNIAAEQANQHRTALPVAWQQLLETALAWYNHNWQTHPYRLETPAAGTAYDFNRHKRAAHTPTGESVQQTLVPGLADSSGKLQIKPLVATA